jgi:diadenosine tetraphosphate (Ap4A) HIT family hydrolase
MPWRLSLATAVRSRRVIRFSTSTREQKAPFDLVRKRKPLLDAEHCPDAFNIGINDGPAAGQTVPHVHPI